MTNMEQTMALKRIRGSKRFNNDKCMGVVEFAQCGWAEVHKGKFVCSDCGERITDYGYYILQHQRLRCPKCYNRAMNLIAINNIDLAKEEAAYTELTKNIKER